MRLTSKQKKLVIACVAEGLESDEINRRARASKPPFQVSRQQVDFYRSSRGVRVDEIKAAGELLALEEGLALRDERVRLIASIAEQLRGDLTAGIRLEGEFKEAEIRQLRGLLDDLAKEVGDRKTKLEHGSDESAPVRVIVEIEDED